MTNEPRPRTSYLGGPDLAAISGFSPYETPYDVYLRKVDKSEKLDNKAMEWGRRLEDVVGQAYSDKTRHTLQHSETIFHPEFNFIGGTPDFLLGSDPNRILEIKTASEDQLRQVDDEGMPTWGEEGSDFVPPHYFAQCQVYMGLTGRRMADLAVFFLGGRREFRIYPIAFDLDLYNILVYAGVEFWNTHVLPRVPPPMDLLPSDQVLDYLGRQGQKGGKAVPVGPALLAICSDLEEVSRTIKAYEDHKDAIKARILAEMAGLHAQKIQGQLYGANFSLAILGGDEGKPVTAWQTVALELARKAGFSSIPEELIHDHTRPGKGKSSYLMPYFTAVRNAMKKNAAEPLSA
jgi:putative phage-type endonuclease